MEDERLYKQTELGLLILEKDNGFTMMFDKDLVW